MLVKTNMPFLSENGFVLVDITRFFWGKPQSPNISYLTSAARCYICLPPCHVIQSEHVMYSTTHQRPISTNLKGYGFPRDLAQAQGSPRGRNRVYTWNIDYRDERMALGGQSRGIDCIPCWCDADIYRYRAFEWDHIAAVQRSAADLLKTLRYRLECGVAQAHRRYRYMIHDMTYNFSVDIRHKRGYLDLYKAHLP
jgi:hypothetical protein